MSVFSKKSICGVCQSDENVKTCSRCQTARYCSRKCQTEDFPQHKQDCKSVVSLPNLLDEADWHMKISYKYPDEDIEKCGCPTFVCECNVRYMCVSCEYHCNLRNPYAFNGRETYEIVSPADYLMLKKRQAEAHWRIASRHRNYQESKAVLLELLEILWMDCCDHHSASSMVPFVMLQLDQIQDAFNFVKFAWLVQPNHLHETLKKDKFYRFKDDQDVYGPVDQVNGDTGEFVVQHDLPKSTAKLTALLAIKIKVVLDLKRFEAFKDVTSGFFAGIPHIYHNIFKHFIGFETSKSIESLPALISEQKSTVLQCLRDVNGSNQYMIQALANPKPVLDRPLPNIIEPGQASEAAEVLSCSLAFFADPEVKQLLVDFMIDEAVEEKDWPQCSNDKEMHKFDRDFRVYYY